MRPALLAALVLLGAVPAAAQRFLPDDPLRRDRDDLPIDPPGEIELATAYDVIEHTFFVDGPKPGQVPPAQNVNTLGEVPDSSWFENRIGARAMSPAGIARGPNRGDGPDPSAPWQVIRGKSGGITPGFTMRDGRGDVYFVKFDPPRYFGLSTGADVIGSKFFHALGYHVPENWIVYFRDDQLEIAKGAKTRQRGAKPRAMTQGDLAKLLQNVARLPDGRIRAVVSRSLPGRVVGPHKYLGTRPDDPNDVIPHEHRRELRGLRVFAAWLNHDDSRSVNSLDTYVARDGGKGHLVHYLQDFSSILGSGSDWRREIAPQSHRAGNEYVVEFKPLFKTLLSLGLWERPWHDVTYSVYPQVGALEADYFDPDRWKPEYPNPAFDRMLPEDALWAALLVARFDEAAVRAIVAEADLRAPEAEEHLVATILKRRSKVLERYLGAMPPLAGFAVEGDSLRFRNGGEEAGVGKAAGYDCTWHVFDNVTGARTRIGSTARVTEGAVPVPEAGAEFLVVRIRPVGGKPGWDKDLDVFIRTADRIVVGVERLP
jgi:hypothetical protein